MQKFNVAGRQVEVREEERAGKKRLVADVQGVKDWADEASSFAGSAKQATKKWDSAKIAIRETGSQIVEGLEQHGIKPAAVNLVGSGKAIIEVELSHRRKDVPIELIEQANAMNFGYLVQSEVEVTLKGSLAAWALSVLGNQTGNPEFHVKQSRHLAPAFESVRASARLNHQTGEIAELFSRLSEAGLFAPAVEAKTTKKKG